MKKNGQMVSLQILLTLCALWGWWGMLYPEFTLTEDTYRIVYEEAEEARGVAAGKSTAESTEDDGETPREIYQRLLHAKRGQIRFRSKLLMQLQDWMEQ